MSGHSGARLAYRPDIDGLRAIAVLGVVLYHAGFGPPGGYIGVDIFFVISGYLITSLLGIELATTGKLSLAAFYARRIRRLLPALALVVTASIAASFLLLSRQGELSDLLRSAAAAAVFVANVYFEFSTGDYFGPNTNHLPLLHLWSLGVEEQYYLLWPVVLIAFHRSARRAGIWVFALVTLFSLALAEWWLYRGSQAAFYAMPSRWWELATGAVVAWMPTARPRIATALAWIGAAICGVAISIPTQHFPGIGALPAVAGSAAILAASKALSRNAVQRFLASTPMTYIGRISYPLYLWHWPLLAITAVAVPGLLPASLRLGLVAASCVLAAATSAWLERPVLRMPLPSPRKLVMASVTVSFAACVMSWQLAEVLRQPPLPNDPASVAERDQPPNRYACHQRGDQPPALPDEAACALGVTGPLRVVIWGDSHALAWQPLADVVARDSHQRAIGFSRDSCLPVIGVDNGKPHLERERCIAFNAMVMRRLPGMDTVILAGRWPDRPSDVFAGQLRATLDALAPAVQRILIVGPTPVLPESVPACLRRNALEACALTQEAFLTATESMRRLLASMPTRHANITYVDPTDYFCPKLTCPPLRGGIALYWDDNHIGTRAATDFAHTWLVRERASARRPP